MTNQQDIRAGVQSASGAERWISCPASFGREAAAKAAEAEEPSSPQATFGTRIHAALDGSLPVSELETAELETFEKIKPLWHQLVSDIGFADDGRVFHVEQRLWIHHPETFAPMLSGQLDLVLVNGSGDVAIVDYKTLLAPAPAHLNWQLRAQAVLFAENFPEYLTPEAQWHLCIIQPNARPQISRCVVTQRDIAMWRLIIEQAILAGSNPDAQAFPGGWCAYCRARKTCREYNAYTALALADTALPMIVELDEKAFRADAVKTWREFSPERKVGKLVMLKLAADLYKDVRAAAEFDLLANPDALAGYAQLVPGDKVRKVTQPVAAIMALSEHGLQAEDLAEAGGLTISIGKAEVAFANAQQAAAGEKLTKGCPDKYKQKFNTVLANFIELEQEKPSLVIKAKAKGLK